MKRLITGFLAFISVTAFAALPPAKEIIDVTQTAYGLCIMTRHQFDCNGRQVFADIRDYNDPLSFPYEMSPSKEENKAEFVRFAPEYSFGSKICVHTYDQVKVTSTTGRIIRRQRTHYDQKYRIRCYAPPSEHPWYGTSLIEKSDIYEKAASPESAEADALLFAGVDSDSKGAYLTPEGKLFTLYNKSNSYMIYDPEELVTTKQGNVLTTDALYCFIYPNNKSLSCANRSFLANFPSVNLNNILIANEKYVLDNEGKVTLFREQRTNPFSHLSGIKLVAYNNNEPSKMCVVTNTELSCKDLIDSTELADTPKNLHGIRKIIKHRTGFCALSDEGVNCWGLEERVIPSLDSNTPEDFSGFKKVAVLSNGVCGLTNSGTTYCWSTQKRTPYILKDFPTAQSQFCTGLTDKVCTESKSNYPKSVKLIAGVVNVYDYNGSRSTEHPWRDFDVVDLDANRDIFCFTDGEKIYCRSYAQLRSAYGDPDSIIHDKFAVPEWFKGK